MRERVAALVAAVCGNELSASTTPPSGPATPPRGRAARSEPDWTPPPGDIVGALDVAAAKGRLMAERDRQIADAQRARDIQHAARETIRGELGRWTNDARDRLAAMEPIEKDDRLLCKRLGRRVWAVGRMASTGSIGDLAYAVQQMAMSTPAEVFGCMVIEAMGLQPDGRALRQLHSSKARRKLVRSWVLWEAGSFGRLREFAGSPSRRIVRGVKRVPQTLLARLCAVGGKPWHRSTTTRDANESHAAGLWRRVRLPKLLAHESEQCGPSGQVVSRYFLEVPRFKRKRNKRERSHVDDSGKLGAVIGVDPWGTTPQAPRHAVHEWAREIASESIVYACHAVALVPRRAAAHAYVPDLLLPLLTHAPPAA